MRPLSLINVVEEEDGGGGVGKYFLDEATLSHSGGGGWRWCGGKYFVV